MVYYVVNAEKCSSCGDCVMVCPRMAIRLRAVAEIDKLKCLACGACERVCPNNAIERIE
ncbi:MAG: 4Fe-4S binding protein [Methermicoccaceae archaeon]